MTIRVSKSFCEGMKYPKRSSESINYVKAIRQQSVNEAWINTGERIRKALDDYGKSFRRKDK